MEQPSSSTEIWAVTPESAAQTGAAMEDYQAGRTIGLEALDLLIAKVDPVNGKK